MIPSLLPRADYPTLERSVYLNQASLGLIGRPAVETMHTFLDDAAASTHIVSIAHPSRSPELAIAALEEQNIVCGTRGGRLRVSLAPYNDEGDVQRFIEAVASCSE